MTFSSQAGTLLRSGLVNVWSGQWFGLVQVLSGLAIEQADSVADDPAHTNYVENAPPMRNTMEEKSRN